MTLTNDDVAAISYESRHCMRSFSLLLTRGCWVSGLAWTSPPSCTHTHTQAKSESHFAQGWYTKGLVAATMQCRFLPCLQRIRNITMHSGLVPPTPKVLTSQNGSGIIPFWICATSAVAGIPDMATPIFRALSKVQEFERYPCITDACQPPGSHSADTFRAIM